MPNLIPVIRRHPVVSSVCALAMIGVVVFGVRAGIEMAHWHDVPVQDQPIEGWMTPRFVVKAWDIPPEVMIEALGEGPMPGKRRTIADIAADNGMTPDELAAKIVAAVQAWRETEGAVQQ